jgi:hypothetical protein
LSRPELFVLLLLTLLLLLLLPLYCGVLEDDDDDDEEDDEDEDVDNEDGEAVEPIDLLLNIELTILLGTSHLSNFQIKKTKQILQIK